MVRKDQIWKDELPTFSEPDKQREANAAFIVKACNACGDIPTVELEGIIAQGGIKAVLNRLTAENAALCAVAEAAKGFDAAVSAITHSSDHLPGEKQRNYISAGLKLRQTLAALEAVRKEAK